MKVGQLNMKLTLKSIMVQAKNGGAFIGPKGITLNVHFLWSGPKKASFSISEDICDIFLQMSCYFWYDHTKFRIFPDRKVFTCKMP